jgi:hypothetical protein
MTKDIVVIYAGMLAVGVEFERSGVIRRVRSLRGPKWCAS